MSDAPNNEIARPTERDRWVMRLGFDAGWDARQAFDANAPDPTDPLDARVPSFNRVSHIDFDDAPTDVEDCSRCGVVLVLNPRPGEDIVLCEECAYAMGRAGAADFVESLRVHQHDGRLADCEDGCGFFSYAAIRLREQGNPPEAQAAE